MIAAIDRFFDLVDGGVARLDRALHRTRQTGDQQQARDRARRSGVIDTEAVPKSSKREHKKEQGSPQTTALTRKSRFYIVEAVVGNETRFVVTDGGNARTECASRIFAEQILQALERSP